MKLLIYTLPLLLILPATVAEPQLAAQSPKVVANATNWFAITGMHCDGCAKGLTFELQRAPGVATVAVSFTNKLAVVAYDTNRVTLKSLQAVVADAGYEAKPAKPPKPRRR